MGKLRKTGKERKGATSESDTGSSSSATQSSTALGISDIERMRSSIQLLVQHTGPLGTCMDYIQVFGWTIYF
jgi:hypothetical protein